jgi:hypothetical protein
LLKALACRAEEHQVVGEDPEREFAPLRSRTAGGEGGTEAALVLAEAALRVPALMVQGAREAPAHRAPVGRLRPAPPGVARVERDDALPQAQLLAAEAVVVLGVVARVRQRRVEGHEGGRLPHGGGEVRRVLGRAGAGDRAQDQGRVGVDDRRELRPGSPAPPWALCLAAAHAEVGADVPGLEPGGVHRGHRRGVDEAGRAGAGDKRGLGTAEGPPLSAPASRRRAAWAKVE